MSEEKVWIPAVPLPFFRGWRYRVEQCVCGATFRGKTRRHDYELHYRREHESRDTQEGVMMEVPLSEAVRIYNEVNSPQTS